MNSLRQKTLDFARKAAIAVGIASSEARIGTLLLLAKLDPNKETYVFSVGYSDQERIAPGFASGLRDQDAFLASRFSLGILPVPIVDGNEAFSAAAPVFWPDPSVFGTAGALATNLSESQALESVYQGQLSLTTNTNVRLEDYHVGDLRTVQQTQGSDATANMQDGAQYHEFGSLIGFHGFEKNQFTLNINSIDKTLLGGPADRNNYLVLKLDGAKIKSGTSALFRKSA